MKQTQKYCALRLAGGAALGAANGVFGGGGGMVAVPLLERLGHRGAAAHATAIAAVLPASLVSAAVYLWAGLVPWTVLLPVALGVAAGGFFGAKLLPLLPPRLVSLLFAGLMLLAGAKALFSWHL